MLYYSNLLEANSMPDKKRRSAAPELPSVESSKEERASQVLSKRSEHVEARRRARDRVCTGPRYPGSPENYTYVLQEYCRPRGRSAVASPAASPSRRRSNNRELVTGIDREIRVIKAALEAYGPEHRKYMDHMNSDALPYVDLVFADMIHPDERAAVPDPLRRYDKVVREALKLRSSTKINVEEMPRYMLLSMVMYHLLAIKATIRNMRTT